MSTTSIAIEQNKIPGRVAVNDHKGSVQEKKPAKSNIFKVFINYLYREMLDLIKSILIIGAFLAVYKVTGLYDLWIEFVGNII